MPEPCGARSPLSYDGAAAPHFVGALEPVAGADAVALDEPDSLLLADFASLLDSLLVSPPAFFSFDADSEVEPSPDSELELALFEA